MERTPSAGSRSRDASRFPRALLAAPVLAALLPAISLAPPASARSGLEALLRQAAAEGLPVEFAEPVAGKLRLRFHELEEFAIAHFAPRPLAPLEGVESGPVPAAGPTLYLYAPAYRRNGGLRPLEDLAVDTGEHLFNALLLAYFELEVLPADSAYRRRLAASAEASLPEVPAAQRLEAYCHALADFGSHLLAVAHQLELSRKRHQRRGSDLCRLADRPHTLFALWDNAFEHGHYFASYYRPAAEDEIVGGWVQTAVPLSRRDKQLLLERVFGGRWRGDREHDLLRRLCPQGSGNGS